MAKNEHQTVLQLVIDRANAEKELKEAAKQLQKQADKLEIEIPITNDPTAIKNLNKDFNTVIVKAKEADKVGKSLSDTIDLNIKSFGDWGFVKDALSKVVSEMKKMVANVLELADAQVELSKVSDLSANAMKNVTTEAFQLGKTVGKTGTQTLNAITQFSRAGYSLESSTDMAHAALMMVNVADGITDSSDAVEVLISVLKGFKMSDTDVMSVVDKMNSVSNQNPISFVALADGLERVSSTMQESGNTIDQTIGLIAGGYTQLQDIDKVSNGLVEIQQRLMGIDEGGNAIEGLSANLKDSFGAIGIAVENSDGSLRSMYDIAKDYANILPTLSSSQKQFYGELAAGKQISVWDAITEQMGTVELATSQSITSVGSASKENETYLKSLSGKVSQLKSSFEELSATLLNSGILDFLVKLGTTGVNAINGIVKALTPLGTLATIGGGILGSKNLGYAI